MEFPAMTNAPSPFSRRHAYVKSNRNPLGSDICRFYNPFNTNKDNSCMRSTACSFKHLTLEQFKQFINNQNPKQLRELGFYFHSHDNHQCSNYAFAQLIRSEANHAVNNFGYAQSFEALNDIKNAEHYYQNALNLAPNDNRCHSLYGRFIHTKKRNFDVAQNYFTTALKLDNSNPFTHCNYGKLLEDMGHLDEAEYHYKQCLSITPKHRPGLAYISRFYHHIKKDLHLAKQYFEALIQCQSWREMKSWIDYFDYSKLLSDMNLFEDALIHYAIALKHAVDSMQKAECYYEMGLIHDAHYKDIQNAQYYFSQAALLNHKQYDMFYQEFTAHHKLKHNTKYDDTTDTFDGDAITQKSSNDPLNNWNTFEVSLPSTKDAIHSVQDVRASQKDTASVTPAHHTIEIEHETKTDDDPKKEANVGKSGPQREFKLFLERVKLNCYYEAFVEKGYDDMRYLDLMEDGALAFMSPIHSKYFRKQIDKFLKDKNKMEEWLKSLGDDLYSEYGDKLECCGIFTFESFYRIVPDKACLLEMIGSRNESDANLLFDNTPKQKRARKMQSQVEGK